MVTRLSATDGLPDRRISLEGRWFPLVGLGLLAVLLIGIPLAMSLFVKGLSLAMAFGSAALFSLIAAFTWLRATNMAKSLASEAEHIRALSTNTRELEAIIEDIQALRAAEERSGSERIPGLFDLSGDTGGEPPALPHPSLPPLRSGSLFDWVLGEIEERYAAREVLTSEELKEALHREVTVRTRSIQETETVCTALGFLGTLIGVILQFYLSKASLDSIASGVVLYGIVLSLATTLQGVLAAVYALFLSRFLEGRFSDFGKDMFRLLRTRILPLLGTGSEEANTIHLIEQGFRDIRREIESGMNNLVHTLLPAMATEMGNALAKHYKTELEAHRNAMKTSMDKVCTNLNTTAELLVGEARSLRELTKEMITTPATLEKTLMSLQESVGTFCEQFAALDTNFSNMREDIAKMDTTMAALGSGLDVRPWLKDLQGSCQTLNLTVEGLREVSRNGDSMFAHLNSFLEGMAGFGDLAEAQKAGFADMLKNHAVESVMDSLGKHQSDMAKLARTMRDQARAMENMASAASKGRLIGLTPVKKKTRS